MRTAGLLQQDSPFTDLQLFIPATQALSNDEAVPGTSTPFTSFKGIQAAGTTAQAQVDTVLVPVSQASFNIKFNLTNLLVRTGMLRSTALTSLSDQAFGTSNGPGPNSIPGTSDPSGFGYGAVLNETTDVFSTGSNTKPPVSSALLPTIHGPLINAGTLSSGINYSTVGTKGIQINWIDAIYQVHGVAVSSLGLILNQYIFAVGHNVAMNLQSFTSVPVAQPGAALSVNSANSAHRERTVMLDSAGNPVRFFTDDGTVVFATLTLATPAGSTVNVAGLVVGCSFNFN
jgi:hypothetical protein